MSETISRVVKLVGEKGAASPLDILSALASNSGERREVQRAIQTALDRGMLRLSANMDIILSEQNVRHAA